MDRRRDLGIMLRGVAHRYSTSPPGLPTRALPIARVRPASGARGRIAAGHVGNGIPPLEYQKPQRNERDEAALRRRA
eukprot:7533841-Alexandrium_andersonii.AAC.1